MNVHDFLWPHSTWMRFMSISPVEIETEQTGTQNAGLICKRLLEEKMGSKSKVNDGRMITENKLKTAARDGEAWGGGERSLIDNLHPLQRVSGDMIESSQAEPIRGALLSEAEQKAIHWHRVPALHRSPFIFMPWLTYWGRRVCERERRSGAGHMQPSICYLWAVKFLPAAKIAHLTWVRLIPFACDFHGSICL